MGGIHINGPCNGYGGVEKERTRGRPTLKTLLNNNYPAVSVVIDIKFDNGFAGVISAFQAQQNGAKFGK